MRQRGRREVEVGSRQPTDYVQRQRRPLAGWARGSGCHAGLAYRRVSGLGHGPGCWDILAWDPGVGCQDTLVRSGGAGLRDSL